MYSRKCNHGRQKAYCRECKGSQICGHNKIKAYCRECKGKQICGHNKIRSQCKKCGGSQICEHNCVRSKCKKCKGGSICIHMKRKARCKICKGSQICNHSKLKSVCKKCGGSSICVHNHIKYSCRECNGSQICKHRRVKSTCKNCKGSQICKHNRIRSQCKDCKGGGICNHYSRRSECIKCTPSRGCQLCNHIYVDPRSRYKPYCFNCYCYLHPDEEIPRRYKIKENYLRDSLVKEFPDIKLVFDKVVKGGCSLRRPDVRLECFTHTIIIECDENRHKGYTCESKRIMQLFQDLGNRPLVVLRFNPDSYQEHGGCFKKTKIGSLSLNKKEWNMRMGELTKRLSFHKDNVPKKELSVEHLFY